MSPQKQKKTLTNWDLVSVNPSEKNWDWKDLFCYWGVNVQSVIGFSLIVSLYVIYDLNTFGPTKVDCTFDAVLTGLPRMVAAPDGSIQQG